MADTDILKEFLVALGFKVDDKKLKGFSKGIDNATKMVGKLAIAAEAMAVAVEAAIVKTSEKFEDLYYASIRMSDSVENIRATRFAIAQLGGTTQDAMRSLESMGEFFRSNPGAERFVQGLGVETRKANGDLRGMTEIMHDLGAQLRNMPYYRAKVVAGVLGIDPLTLQALLRDTGEFERRYHSMAERMGVDQDKAAEASHNFMNDLRELMGLLELTLDKIVLVVQPIADKVTKGLEDMDEATGGASTALIVLGAALGPLLLILDPIVVLIAAVAAAVAYVIATFSDWRTAGEELLGGLTDIWDALQPLVQGILALGEVLLKTFGPGLRPLLDGTFKVLGDGLHMIADIIRLVIDLMTGNWAKAWADNKRLGQDMFKTLSDTAEGLLKTVLAIGRGAKDAWEWLHGGKGGQAPAAAPKAAGGAPPPAGNDNVGGGAGVADTVSKFFKDRGFTPEAVNGIVAGMFAETQLKANAVNPKSGAYGIGQWLGPRKAELFKRYGSNPSLQQQLEFMTWEMTNSEKQAGGAVRGARNSMEAMEAYVRKFMRPGGGTAGDLTRGRAYLTGSPGGAKHNVIHVNQKTTIHVDGSKDPHATGKAVAHEQEGVHAGMARQMKAAAS